MGKRQILIVLAIICVGIGVVGLAVIVIFLDLGE